MQAWLNNAELYSLPVDALGHLFLYAGKYYRITGLDVTKRTVPVITVNDHTGKRRNFRAATIRFKFKTDKWGLPVEPKDR